jgi:hypothetical protein
LMNACNIESFGGFDALHRVPVSACNREPVDAVSIVRQKHFITNPCKSAAFQTIKAERHSAVCIEDHDRIAVAVKEVLCAHKKPAPVPGINVPAHDVQAAARRANACQVWADMEVKRVPDPPARLGDIFGSMDDVYERGHFVCEVLRLA